MPLEQWKQIDSQYIVKDRWVSLRADNCVTGNGQSLNPYYVMEERDWVHAVAIDEQGRFLLVRQYRYAGGLVCREFPGGEVDPGEDPIRAAQRELLEETGYKAKNWEKIGEVFANPARQTNRVYTFLARDLQNTGQRALDEGEEIETAFATLSEIKRAIKTGDFRQSLHISSLFLVQETLNA